MCVRCYSNQVRSTIANDLWKKLVHLYDKSGQLPRAMCERRRVSSIPRWIDRANVDEITARLAMSVKAKRAWLLLRLTL